MSMKHLFLRAKTHMNNIDDMFSFVMNRIHESVEFFGLSDNIPKNEVIILSSEGQNVGGTISDYTDSVANGAIVNKNYKIWYLNSMRDTRIGNPTQALPNPLTAVTPEEFLFYREEFAPTAILEISANSMIPSIGLGFTARVEERADGKLYLYDIKQTLSPHIQTLLARLGLESTAGGPFGRKVYPKAASKIGAPSAKSDNKIKPVGWTTAAGGRVVLNDLIVSFMNEVAKKAPTIPIIVNSGYRDEAAQSAAILRKMQLGDTLSKIYGSKTVAALINATANSENKIAYVDGVASPNFGETERKAIEAWYKSVDWKSSTSHLSGKAVDLRSIHLTDTQLAMLRQAISAVGEYGLLEKTPEHIHVTIKSFQTLGAHNGQA